MLSYLVPAMVASVILNIPKFLEARLEEVVDLYNLSSSPPNPEANNSADFITFSFGQMDAET